MEMKGRVVPVRNCAFAQLKENEHIEEVHTPEYKDNGANLQAQDFHYLTALDGCFPDFQRVHCVANVDEIEANEQQVIDGLGQFLIAMENVY